MLDRAIQARLAPALTRVAALLARSGVQADQVTLAGFAVGLLGAGAIAAGHFTTALALLAASRLADGLDGALARLTRPTDRGAFLDIACDFVFYALVVLAFAWVDTATNALAAATLLASFMGTASSFLAFAVLAERRGLPRLARPSKGIHYLGGLVEGTETLLCFGAMCLWPQAFAALAYGLALACAVTTASRFWLGWTQLADAGSARR
jgi:phosphatidylglycerophosphate synthase